MLKKDDKMFKAKANLSEYRKTGDYDHRVTFVTNGYNDLELEERLEIMKAFHAAPKGDHLYVIESQGRNIFIAENGQGYTAMLPEEY